MFDCIASELIGKKLSCFFKKTSQVLEEVLEEIFPLVDGSVRAVTGKVVRNVLSKREFLIYFFLLFHSKLHFCLQVDVVTPSGEIPASVCTYRQSQDQDHWIIMVESVERVSACVTFSQEVG